MMRNGRNITKLFILVISYLCIGCGSDDLGNVEQALAFEKLSGNWDMSQGGTIIIDGVDASANFQGFSLSFTEGDYSTANAGDLFKPNGTWEWGDETAQLILLDDGKEVQIVTLTETEFVFSFTFSGTGGSANGVNGMSGIYTISINK